MIQIILYLAYVIALLLCCGRLAEMALCRVGMLPGLATRKQNELEIFTDLLFLGLIFLATFLSAVSLVHPITGNSQLLVSGAAFAFGGLPAIKAFRVANHESISRRRRWFIVFVALFYLTWAVVIASGEVRVYDTGTYHVQTMLWLKEYGIVPGVANLFPQLGFNSAWHVFCSFLDHGALDHGRSYHVAGPLMFVCCLAFGLESCWKFAAGRRSLSNFLGLFGFVAITFYYRNFIASLGTDFIAAILVFYALVRTSEVMEKPSAEDSPVPSIEQRRALVCVTVVTCFAVTVKLSVLPCLLLPCLLWLRRFRHEIRLTLSHLVLAVGIGLPLLARNYVISGYLLYPQTQIDLFHCDWKVPAADVRVLIEGIRVFSIGAGRELNLADMGVVAKLTTWFHAWGNLREVQWLLVWAAAGLGSCCLMLFCRRCKLKHDLFWWWSLFGVVMTGVLFCVVTAPEPRFLGVWGLAMGYFPMACLVSLLADCFTARIRILVFPVAMTLLIAFGLFLCMPGLLAPGLLRRTIRMVTGNHPSTRVISQAHTNSSTPAGPAWMIWTLRELPEVAITQEQSTNGATVNLPAKSNKLWDAPLPAAQRLHPWLQMRGASIKDGFRVTQEAGWPPMELDYNYQRRQAMAP